MKIYRSQGTTNLIAILDCIYNDEYASIRLMQNRLLKLKHGDPISQDIVDNIFGKWANNTPDPENPRHVISHICAFLKTEMFR